jgi:hypothetical protein
VHPLANQGYACSYDWDAIDRVEAITSVHRRRRWAAEEKAAMVQETYAPWMCRCRWVTRQHGIAPNRPFRWYPPSRGHALREALDLAQPANRCCAPPSPSRDDTP